MVSSGTLIADGVVNFNSTLDATSSTAGGALTIDGGTAIAKKLYVGGDTNLGGDLTIGGDISATGGSISIDDGTFGNIRIAVTGDNEIDTSSGGLTLDSTTGTTTVDDNLTVNGNLNVDGDGVFTGDVIAFSSSDERLKDNITAIPDALTKVVGLSGNTFTWNEASNKEGDDIGVIAQEVAALGLPGLTTIRDDGTYAVRYERLIPLLIQAIKELNDKVENHSH